MPDAQAHPKPNRCQAQTRSGTACGATVVDAVGHCAWHSTEARWAEKRKEWSAKGGRGKANDQRARKALPAGTLTLDELRALVGRTIKDTLGGRVEPGVASAVGSLARTYLAIDEATKLDALADRLDQLERQAARGSA